MKALIAIDGAATLNYWLGLDNKQHLAVGVYTIFLGIALFIFLFDRWVIKK
jgi:hypothetical protein